MQRKTQEAGMSQSIVGASTPQVTAREKVMGRAQYAGDIKLAGILRCHP